MGSIGMSYSGVEEYGLLEGSLLFAEEMSTTVGGVGVVDGENTMLRGREDVERSSDYGLLGEGLMGVVETEFSLGYPIAKGHDEQESSTSSIRSFCSSTSTRESVFRGGSLHDTDVFSVTTGTPSLEEQGSQSIDSSVTTTLVAGAVDPLMAYTGCTEMGTQVPYGQNQSPSMAFPTTLRSQGEAAQTTALMEQVHSTPQLQRQALDENKPASEQLRKVPRQRRCSRRASGTIASVYNNNTSNYPPNSQNNSSSSGNSPTSTSSKKVSDSRLSAQGLAEFLKLNSAEEALRRERFVLDILENELHYPLGYKTWVRDTSKKYRSQLLNLLHKRVRVKYPEYDKSVLETIIRRATYYMMQSRLRRERRAKAKCENNAKCNSSTQPMSATCDKNGTAHLFGASANALCQSERNPNLKPGHQGKDGENWCV